MGRKKTCLHSESLSASLKEENIAKRKYKSIIAENIENKITEKKLSNKPPIKPKVKNIVMEWRIEKV